MSAISVSIGADVSDLQVKRAVLSAELKAATADLNAFAKQAATGGMTSELRAGMQSAAEAATRFKTEIVGVDGAMKALRADSVKVSPFAGLTNNLGGVKQAVESFGAIKTAIAGFGEAFAAAFAVEGIAEWGRRMGEGAEHSAHLSQETGLTTGQVQELGAMAAATGMNLDTLTKGVGRLDLAFAKAKEGSKQQKLAFDEMGVSLRENVDNWTLIEQVADKFKDMADGPAKAALAIQLFGRSGLELIPFLNLGKTGLEQLRQAVDAYGVKSADAQTKGEALGRSFNENHVAMMGLQNVMVSAFAPGIKAVVDGVDSLIKGFVQSYNSGGLVKIALDKIVLGLKATFVPIETLGLAFAEAWDVAKHAGDSFRADFDLVKEYVLTAIDAMTGSFKSFALTVGNALAGNWIGAAKAGMDGVDRAMQAVAGHSAALAAAHAKVAAVDKAWLTDATKDLANYKAGIDALFNGSSAKGLASVGTGGGTGDDPSGKAKQHATDMMEVWKAAFRQVEADHSGMLHNEDAVELSFWQNLLATTDVTQKQRTAIEAREGELRITLNRQAINDELSDARTAEQDKVSAINATLSATREAMNSQVQAQKDAAGRGVESYTAALASIKSILAKEVDAERQAAVQIYLARISLDEDIKSSNDSNTKAFADANNDEQRAWQALMDAMVKAKADADKQIVTSTDWAAKEAKAKWEAAVSPMVSSFTGGFLKMAEGAETFSSFMANLGKSMAQNFLTKVVDKGITDFLYGEHQKVAAAVAGQAGVNAVNATGAAQGLAISGEASLKDIVNSAASAAASAYKAMAGIPVIGPELGAAAAAATFAGAVAFRGLIASAAGGYDIPMGVNPMVQAHAEEMILPASIARPWKSVLAGFDGNGAGGGGAGGLGGTTEVHHHHHYQINAMDGASVRRVLMDNPGDHAAAMEKLVRGRNGKGFGA